MDKLLLVVLGVGLALSGFISLLLPHSGVPLWMTWADLAGSLCVFFFALSESRGHRASPLPLVSLLIGLGLSVSWVLGTLTEVAPWANVSNFALSMGAFFIFLVSSFGRFQRGIRKTDPLFPLGAAIPFHTPLFPGVANPPYFPNPLAEDEGTLMDPSPDGRGSHRPVRVA